MASKHGHVEIVKKLLAAGANPDTELGVFTALGAAAHFGQLLVLEELLAAGADIERITGGKLTHCKSQSVRAIKLLSRNSWPLARTLRPMMMAIHHFRWRP